MGTPFLYFMKKLGIVSGLIIGVILIFSFSKNNKPEPTVIVELFTSQGCSSCPSADKLLSELSEKENVLALSFHVSYWNYLGWKDPYSSEQFTERQRAYAKKLHLSSIYTPQIIVNGQEEFVGSNRASAEKAIGNATSSQTVTLEVRDKTTSSVQLYYILSGGLEDKLLNIALVERHVQNKVPRGENRGKVLEHNNVVRVFKTLEAKASGEVQITIPEGFDSENADVVAFLQSKKTWEVTGGNKVSL